MKTFEEFETIENLIFYLEAELEVFAKGFGKAAERALDEGRRKKGACLRSIEARLILMSLELEEVVYDDRP